MVALTTAKCFNSLMNWLDIIILIVLALQVFTGLRQGLIKALGGLLGLIVGIVLAGRFHETLAGNLSGFISNPDIANVVAFIAILLVVWAVFSIVAGLLTKLASMIFLGWINRLGGAVFGLLMGALFVGAALAAWARFFGTTSLADSFMATFLLDKFPVVLALLPSQFDSIKEFFQ
jgi:membrane protein required for colicin V production